MNMPKPRENPKVRYERRDITLRWLLILLAAAASFAVIHYYSTWKYYWWKADIEAAAKRSPYPAAPRLPVNLPPPPRLEQLDLVSEGEAVTTNRRLAAQEASLHEYGPSSEKGFVHIPIEQAMRIVAAEAAATPSTDPDDGQVVLGSGEADSGRSLRAGKP